MTERNQFQWKRWIEINETKEISWNCQVEQHKIIIALFVVENIENFHSPTFSLLFLFKFCFVLVAMRSHNFVHFKFFSVTFKFINSFLLFSFFSNIKNKIFFWTQFFVSKKKKTLALTGISPTVYKCDVFFVTTKRLKFAKGKNNFRIYIFICI